MHELTATQSILDIVLTEAARAGARRVTRVRVKSGQWSTFQPDCIAFYFGILSRETPAEGASIEVETLPVRYLCNACGMKYEPIDGRFACPRCAGVEGKIVGGREFYIESIEVENADTVGAQSP